MSKPIIRIDLDGQCFNITQDFMDKYPESMLAKSMMVANGQEMEPIELDRDGKYFSKILEYSRGNRSAFKLSQMSLIEIKELINDLNFFGVADDLVMQCERELTFKNQRCIECVTSEKQFEDILSGENRILIILDHKSLDSEARNVESCIEKALKLVDRNKCLIVGYNGEVKSIVSDSPASWCSILYDPVTSKILLSHISISEETLLQMIYYANTLHQYAMLTRVFTYDHSEGVSDVGDIGKTFLRVELIDDM